MTIDIAALANWLPLVTSFAVAYLLALWVSLVIWAFRDIRHRTRDPLARILALLLVAILFLPGALLYLLLRPARTIEADYQQTLEEEAFLEAIEQSAACPGCSRRVHSTWTICPTCHTRLKKRCRSCGEALELSWTICPTCGEAQVEAQPEKSLI